MTPDSVETIAQVSATILVAIVVEHRVAQPPDNDPKELRKRTARFTTGIAANSLCLALTLSVMTSRAAVSEGAGVVLTLLVAVGINPFLFDVFSLLRAWSFIDRTAELIMVGLTALAFVVAFYWLM